MTKLYFYGLEPVIIGDYIFVVDGWGKHGDIARGDKMTMEVTKFANVGGQFGIYQRDSTHLFVANQQQGTWYYVIHVFNTEMEETSVFTIATRWADEAKMAVIGDKLYFYLGSVWSNELWGYIATVRVYSMDGSYVDIATDPWNGSLSGFVLFDQLIERVANGSGALASIAAYVTGCAEKFAFTGADIISTWRYGGEYSGDEQNPVSNPRRISSVDLTVTIPHHFFVAGLRDTWPFCYGQYLYTMMPAPGYPQYPDWYFGEDWVGPYTTVPSLFKWDLATMELVSWVPNNTGTIWWDSIRAPITDGTYVWAANANQYKLSDCSQVTFLWTRKVEPSNAIWFVNSI